MMSLFNNIGSRGAKCVELARVNSSFIKPIESLSSTSYTELKSVPFDQPDINEIITAEFEPDFNENITIIENEAQEIAKNNDVIQEGNVSIDTTDKKKLTRKRRREPEKWKRNVLKVARNTGREYTSLSGNKHLARFVLPATCKCPILKCQEKIMEEERSQICQTFWALGNIDDQITFIAQHVEKQEVSRRRKPDSESSRSCTVKYFLTIRDNKINVCRHFFIKTLSISETMIKTVFKKMSEQGVVAKDKRGANRPAFARPLEAKENIRNHINALPVVESHYCGSTSKRRYLPAGLSINKLYLDYKNFCAEKNIQPEKAYMYRHIFNSEYNYGFETPKKDQCDRCTTFNNMNDDEKLTESENQNQHLLRKEQARQHKQNDKQKSKENQNFSSWCFDMEKVLLTPNLKVGKLYYKRKLQVFNFTMYDLESKDVICYMWCECDGKKGSSETASCLWQFFQNLPEHITEISLFSDTAGGQNRNQNVAMCCLLAVRSIPHLNIINQKFMESGHSEMECDSVHSTIEKKTKHMPIYVPAGWYSAVRAARISKPYKVVEMGWENFQNFPALTDKEIKNKKKTTTGEEINWLCLKWILYRKDEPTNLYVKNNLDNNQEFKIIPIDGKRKSNRQSNKENLQLNQLYDGPLPIAKNKKNDLMSLCMSKAIKSNYHTFYESIKAE